MKFYVSTESCRKIKKAFSNLNTFHIIDVDGLIHDSGFDISKPVHMFILNTEIRKLIEVGINSKRFNGIIYLNSNLCVELVNVLKETLADISSELVDDIILLDDYDVPKHKIMYKYFDEIVFFPMHKKTKIVECKPILAKKDS